MIYTNNKKLIILDADGTTIDAYNAIEKSFNAHGMNLGDEESFQKRHHIFKYLGGIKQFPANLRKNITTTKRYVSHLPAGGEIVLFDRSWYNRAGVERVMGFCDDEEYEEFFRAAPDFERMLVRSGIQVIKYWFSISDEEQNLRFLGRIHDPLKQWKLSSMDLESRRRWELYTKAKEIMLERTHIPEAPWWVVEAIDKKKARLNCIHHLLNQMPYEEIKRPIIDLPKREYHDDYTRRPIPAEMFIPEVY